MVVCCVVSESERIRTDFSYIISDYTIDAIPKSKRPSTNGRIYFTTHSLSVALETGHDAIIRGLLSNEGPLRRALGGRVSGNLRPPDTSGPREGENNGS